MTIKQTDELQESQAPGEDEVSALSGEPITLSRRNPEFGGRLVGQP
jgi:hypothetical protein